LAFYSPAAISKYKKSLAIFNISKIIAVRKHIISIKASLPLRMASFPKSDAPAPSAALSFRVNPYH